ncbi:MAG: DUF4255 domain-containing protein [Gammaproteobacteria bacterium]
MYTALRATTKTLTGLLSAKIQADPELGVMFDPVGTMLVSPNTPQEMGVNSQAGLSVWLYRIVRDEFTLNAPPRRVGIDRVEHPPLPMRLYYLMTPFVDSTEDGSGTVMEQTILGLVLQTLNDKPVLKGADLLGEFAGTDTEITVRLESLDLEEITRIWDSLESSYQLSVSYEVSVVPIDTGRQPMAVAPVKTVGNEYGKIIGTGVAADGP